MRFKILWPSLFLIFIPFLIFPALADRGMIPLTPAILEEAEQNAIIAWNGEEEILILSTTVKASNNTTVVEILPLPSKPEVKKSDIEQFHRLLKILNSERRKMGGFGFTAQKGPGFEIVFQERIGMHYLTVVFVRDSSEFADWFRSFVAGNGFDASFPDKFSSIVEDYTSRGYKYFAIDLINVSKKEKTVEPIQYRFKSDRLYYPLRITSTIKSNTRINLFILADGIVNDEDLRKAGLWNGFKSDVYTYLNRAQLREVNPDIAEVLDGAYFTGARYYGEAEILKTDLEVFKLRSPSIYEHFMKLTKGTTIHICLSGLSFLNAAGGGIGFIFASIVVFSPFLGFAALFLVVYRAEFELNPSLRSRRSLSFILPLITVTLTALLPGILAFIAMFVLFFLGVAFALYLAFRAVGMIFKAEG